LKARIEKQTAARASYKGLKKSVGKVSAKLERVRSSDRMANTHAAVAQGEHGHHHAHHFDSAEHEFEASKQGMWVFMVTEVLMVGGLFVAYGIFRGMYPEMFKAAHQLLSVKLGATNTVILLISSLTMAMAVSAAQRGERKKSLNLLLATIVCGFGFLIVKYFEYSSKIHHGILPGGLMTSTELKDPKSGLFFSLYFMMTGVHALHVIVGMGLITWLIKRTARGDFGPGFYTPVELVGFYWHFVDLVWIYLFPLLYLVG
jgi:cytochrome c oxidase subunit 3